MVVLNYADPPAVAREQGFATVAIEAVILKCPVAAKMSVIDSITMSAHAPGSTLVVPTDQGPGERSRT
jgi:hypothetical protein